MPERKEDQDRTESFVSITAPAMVSHYRIIKRIGLGGMGEVYLAEDEHLGRHAALKFLAPLLCDDADCRRRFTREAQAAAKLDHPNIVTVYQVGEHQGRPFFAMQYIDGQSLKDYAAGKELSLDEILDFGIQLAEGLQAAHDQGVTHRDIKPSNILIDGQGRARIVDFGLALIKGGEHLTEVGTTMGTFGYMSPEQVRGEACDARSDLFSLGIVLYELITGQRPFAGENLAAIIDAITRKSPPPLVRYTPAVLGRLQPVFNQLLAKDRNARYRSAAELGAALQSIRDDSAIRSVAARTQTSIAVLPFVNLSVDEAQEYFCDGMAEEIINALAKVRGLHVAARTSSFVFKNKTEDIREIGRKLNVISVLEGSVRKAGNRLRVTAQLSNSTDGYQLWSGRYDRELEDIFVIQDEIAENIARALQVVLTDDEKRAIERIRTTDTNAYDYYLRGRQFLHQGRRKSLDFALEMFMRATEVDSDYALAYTGIADCCCLLIHFYPGASSASLEQADRASRRALQLDPRLAEAHATRGFVLWLMDHFTEAQAEFETAILLDSGQFDAYRNYARACFQRGLLTQSATLYEQACRVREDYEARFFAAQTYAALGETDQAKKSYQLALDNVEQHLELNPDDARAFTMAAVAHFQMGQPNEGLQCAERAMTIDPDDAGIRYNTACLFALEGYREKAIKYLEEAFKAGFANMEWVEKDPDLASLRDDPNFQALLRQYTGGAS